MTKTMTPHLICATITALVSLNLVTNLVTANSDGLIIDPVIGPPEVLPKSLPLVPIGPVVGPPVILPEPLPVLPIGPIVAPPLTQPQPLPLIPGPGGTWSPSAQPKVEDSPDVERDPTPLQQTPPVAFDYSEGPNGPNHWGELKADWAICKSGFQQSPLSITPNLIVTDSTLGSLEANYTAESVDASISHDGMNLQVEVPFNVGILKIYNITYRPVSFHFHRPSEHRILNYSFPLELHLVHKSKENKTAIIAWLFVSGSKNNTFLAQFLNELPAHKKPYIGVKIPPIKLLQLEPNYGRYRGSLTTPPCSETVIWTLMLWNFPSISDYQLKQLKVAIPRKNARPSFPSYGRKFRINHTPNWTWMGKAFKDMTS